MASDTIVKAFPSNRFEALTMLYLQNQDLSGLTPEQILDKYLEAYSRILAHNRQSDSETC